MERNEFEADSMADTVRTYNGAEPEDPMHAFRAFADDLGLRRGRVGMEVPAYYLHAHHYQALKAMLGEALVAEPNGLVAGLKQVKSDAEISYVRKSAELAGAAWQALLVEVAEGKSELELAAAAYRALLAGHSALPASTMNLMTGERSCFALGAPTERRQRPGDTGLVEIGGAYRRYTSTLGRQWLLGEAKPRLEELHDVVLAASDACMAEMRDGVPAIVPHEALKRVFVEAGLDGYRQHTSGYGMAAGFPPSWGEGPSLFGGTEDVLKAGMVISVEPALFLRDEALGVRLIDNCLITESGVEVLSTTPRAIAVVD
jgi:Xaa-Pro dipeptidase